MQSIGTYQILGLLLYLSIFIGRYQFWANRSIDNIDQRIIVVIPEDEGAINLAWFLYEFIALAIPMKHVHAPGKCNKAMSSKLKKHTARSTEDGDEEYEDDSVEEDIAIDDDVPVATDPRWDGLKGLLENDNN